MKKLILALYAIAAFAASPTKFRVSGTPSAQQALLTWDQTFTGTCTLEVSESATYSPVVADVDTALFAGSNVTPSGAGSQQFLVGKRAVQLAATAVWTSRSLAADTTYYARLNCNSEFAYLTFTTRPVSGINPEAPLWDSAAFGNYAAPDFDMTDRTKPVIDPQSGAKIYRISNTSDFGFVRAANFPSNSAQGGTGWTNLQNITSGLSSGTVATTTNTNRAFVPFDSSGSLAYAGYFVADQINKLGNVGIRGHGSATDTTGENAKLLMCLSIDSQTCYTSDIEATFTGSASSLSILPSAYTSGGWIGWSKQVPSIYQMSVGCVTATASTSIILTGNYDGCQSSSNLTDKIAPSVFRTEWAPGMKIFITGTSPTCTNNYCTLVSVESATRMTIQESITVSNAVYRSAGWGVLVGKKTAVGALNFSLTFSEQVYKPLQQGQALSCSAVPVTTTKGPAGEVLGYTVTGYLCLMSQIRDARTKLYFVPDTPGRDRPRILSLVPAPSMSGLPVSDRPNSPGAGFSAGPSTSGQAFDSTDGNRFYVSLATQAAGNPQALFSVVYPSANEYVEPAGIANSFSAAGTISGYTDPLVWTNLTRASEGRDLSTQILANTTYNTSLWPSLNSLGFSGVGSGYSVFSLFLQSQEYPAAIFLFDQSGNFASWSDGLSNSAPGVGPTGLHALVPVPGPSNQVRLATTFLFFQNSSIKFGGPFEFAAVDCVYKSGVCNLNTSLPGNIGAGNGYDATCPVDLPAWAVADGAVGDQCFTMETTGGEACSAFPNAAELAAFPCPTNAAKSWMGRATVEKDSIYDASGNPSATDNEQFMVVRKTDLGAGRIRWVLLRDSSTGYSCQQNPPGTDLGTRGRNCAAGLSQAAHLNGWKGWLIPSSNVPVQNPVTQAWIRENQWLTRGHIDYSVREGQATQAGIMGNSDKYYGRIGPVGTNANATLKIAPNYAGISTSSNWYQSYISVPGFNALGQYGNTGSDWRHPNNGASEPEYPGAGIGSILTMTLQGGTTSVWKVSGINGSYNAKKSQVLGWSGAYSWSEKSSPTLGDTLTDSDPWRVCHAYAAGECRTGSTAGDWYAVIPKPDWGIGTVNTSGTAVTWVSGEQFTNILGNGSRFRIGTTDYTVSSRNSATSLTLTASAGVQAGAAAQWNVECRTAQVSLRQPCFFVASPILGRGMQMLFTPDPDGVYQRRISDLLTRPGAQYGYSHLRQTNDGKCAMGTTYQMRGWLTTPILICTGQFVNDAANRTEWQPVAVKGSGTSWYVEFGYDANFYCTQRAEACKVAASTINATTPFYFAGETMTAASGSATVTIPAMPGRALYYRTVVNGAPSAVKIVVIP
jgi:hypothetical protein